MVAPRFKETLRNNKPAVAIIFVIGIVSLVSLIYDPVREFLISPTAFRDWVRSLGPSAPLIIIVYHALQVIFPTFPGLAIDITNGYLYGLAGGLAVSLTGILLGTIVAVLIARRYGRPFVKTIAAGSRLNPDRFLNEGRLRFFFLVFLIPGGPHDILTYIIGLVQAPFWKVILTALVGRLPTLVGAVLLGTSGSQLSPAAIIGLTAIVANIVVPVIIWLTIKRSWQKQAVVQDGKETATPADTA